MGITALSDSNTGTGGWISTYILYHTYYYLVYRLRYLIREKKEENKIPTQELKEPREPREKKTSHKFSSLLQ
ncbi:hypothetical protein BDV26DRAFT_257715 [Aspergillus bertholletiae]|uniref:Uncharacterized protein n=1 Tax=Aspergillus bertholletiae TaxID=1226010 RepID=A0A5N7BET1_9EURO|nr:hypothetical protein BDV26DRAFT_257715 [Aspergillus bertholletiae]